MTRFGARQGMGDLMQDGVHNPAEGITLVQNIPLTDLNEVAGESTPASPQICPRPVELKFPLRYSMIMDEHLRQLPHDWNSLMRQGSPPGDIPDVIVRFFLIESRNNLRDEF